MSPSHREALGSILYGIKQRKGVILVTGEVGVGKTTVLRRYLQIAAPMQDNGLQGQKTVHLYNPNVGFNRLLITILHQLGAAPCSDETDGMIGQVHELAKEEQRHGGTVVVIIDEAQSLPVETLEGIRMLTNLETANEKLIQIALIGQPELETLLERHELRHVRERVAVRARIWPLTKQESLEYIQFRLNQASREQVSIFSAGALAVIVKAAQGVPRRLNILCDNALITGFRRREPIVSRRIAKSVVMDGYEPWFPLKWMIRPMVLGAVSLAIAVPLLGYVGTRGDWFAHLTRSANQGWGDRGGDKNASGKGLSQTRETFKPETAFRVEPAAFSPPQAALDGHNTAAWSAYRLGIMAISAHQDLPSHHQMNSDHLGIERKSGNAGTGPTTEPTSFTADRAAAYDPPRELIRLDKFRVPPAVSSEFLVENDASSDADRSETARLLAVLLDAGRIVLGKAQATINNPRLEGKGFSSSVFLGRLRKEFQTRTGHDLHDLRASAMPELAKPLVVALSAVMQTAVNAAQSDINRKGIGFKGFIPATFGTKVAEEFSKETGVTMRQIGPPDTEPRNPDNKPDDEEELALLAIQKSHPRAGDHVIEQHIAERGIRILLPLFYSKSCLGCHGRPKGEIDISGYKKEGFKEGDLGGAISVLFPAGDKPLEQTKQHE